MNKDWRIQVAETRTVYCKHVRQVKLRKQGWALRRLGQVAQGSNGQPSVQCSESRKQQRSGITGAGSDEKPLTMTQADNLRTWQHKTGSNIAPVNDPQLERISLNQTHPYTDTCTHTHTHNRARMGPRAHEPWQLQANIYADKQMY